MTRKKYIAPHIGHLSLDLNGWLMVASLLDPNSDSQEIIPSDGPMPEDNEFHSRRHTQWDDEEF